jgi:hypothetical protein
MIDNLQYLFVVMDLAPGEREAQFNFDLASFVRCLHDSMVTKSLKDLTIAVKISLYQTWDNAVTSFSNATAWTDMDYVLYNPESVLKNVRIFVDLQKSMVADEQLQTSMQVRLPRLHEHGILFIGTGATDNL